MTGQNAGPVKLLLRAPPHLPFVQGWPGIPAAGNREAATVKGAVELRIGSAPVKAKWVRVEVRKHEHCPAGALNQKNQSPFQTQTIGKVHTLWKAQDGKEYEQISTTDYRFVIPLPVDVPPSCELSTGARVSYDLVASVCYKSKGHLFKKDQSSVQSVTEKLHVIKYELASAWPTHNTIERRSAQAQNGQATLTVERPAQAFGALDLVNATASLKSQSAQAFVLKGFDTALVEVFTVYPPPPDSRQKSKKLKAPSPPTVKRTTIAMNRAHVNQMVGPGEERSARLDLLIPAERSILTVQHASCFKVEYELVVEAACDGGPGKVLLSGMPCIIGTFSRSASQQAVRDIGFVEGLCPRPGHQTAASMASPPGQLHPSAAMRGHQPSASHSGQLTMDAYNRSQSMRQSSTPPQASQPPQHEPSPQQLTGFTPREKWRRSSSGTTATTTTTALTDYGPTADRNASTMPLSRPNLSFPSPNPASPSSNINGKIIADSPFDTTPEDPRLEALRGGPRASPVRPAAVAQAESPQDTTPSRLSTLTDGTFGNRNSVFDRSPTTPTTPGGLRNGQPPTAFDKSRLYGEARVPRAAMDAGPAPPEFSPATPSSGASRVAALATEYMTAAQEKELQRRRFEEAQNRVVSASDAGPAKSVSNGFSASRSTSTPITASAPPSSVGHVPDEDPIPYDAIVGAGPSSSKPAVPAAYMSAVEEKDMMRRRFEEAQNRVAQSQGRSASSPAPSMSSHGHSSTSHAYLTAAEEKDRMRARYEEAQNRVARVGGVSVSPVAASSTARYSTTTEEELQTAAEEKDQMRQRYEDAMRRVAHGGRAASVQDDEVMGPPPPPIILSSGPRQYYSLEEKEQIRRRYEEEVARRAFGESSSSGSAPPAAAPAAYLSAAEEKDVMRRRYEEAQARVARSHGSMDSTPTRAQTSLTSSPVASASSHMPSLKQEYMSAAEEKEMMRRRYEDATRRMRGESEEPAGAGPGPSVSSSSTAPVDDPISYDELFGGSAQSTAAGPSSSTPGPSSSAGASNLPAAYMSAADEKEMMRRRYEEAQERVARRAGSQSPPSSPPQAVSSVLPPSRSMTGGFMSAEQEKDGMRPRYQEAQDAVYQVGGGRDAGLSEKSPGRSHVRGMSLSQRAMSAALPDGPPPPLPTRPPREYIDML